MNVGCGMEIKNKEETFEDKYLELIGQINISIQDWGILKQLHDTKIEELNDLLENEKCAFKLCNIANKEKDKQISELQAEVKNLREIIDLNLGQLNNKRKIISNLQAEVKELKIRLQNEYDEQAGSSL